MDKGKFSLTTVRAGQMGQVIITCPLHYSIDRDPGPADVDTQLGIDGWIQLACLPHLVLEN